MATTWQQADLVLEVIERLLARSGSLPRDVLVADHDEQDLLAYRLMIVAEMVGRLPDDVRARHPQVAWDRLRGLRNRLAHDYEGLDHVILWTVLTSDLPVLVAVLKTIVAERLP